MTETISHLEGFEAGLKAALEIAEAYSKGAGRRLEAEENKADEGDGDYGEVRYFEGKVDALLDVIGSLKVSLPTQP